MENYAGSSTLLIFDVVSASITVGIRVLRLVRDFLDSGSRRNNERAKYCHFFPIPHPSPFLGYLNQMLCGYKLNVEDLRGKVGNGGSKINLV